MLSDYLVRSIIEEKHRDAMHLGHSQRQVEPNQLQHKKNNLWSLKNLIIRLWYGQSRQTTMDHSEKNLCSIDIFDISSPDDNNRLEKRNQYERIVQGHVLFEAEALSQKLWETR